MAKPTTCKWGTFTYVGKEMSYITNVFRRAHLKIVFRTKNTIGNLLGIGTRTPIISH